MNNDDNNGTILMFVSLINSGFLIHMRGVEGFRVNLTTKSHITVTLIYFGNFRTHLSTVN